MLAIINIMYVLLQYNLYIKVHGEIFSAIAEIKPLLKTHKRLIDNLDFYFHNEERRVAWLKKYLHEFESVHIKAIKDDTYLSNSINVFTLIKKISIDLDHIEVINIQLISIEYIVNLTLTDKSLVFPTEKDLKGAADAIARLQQTYKLDVKDLAAGKLNGVVYSMPMTASDCYEIGRTLHKSSDYINVHVWMIEAFQKYNKEKHHYNFTEVDILEYIIFAYFSLDDMENALKWTYTLLDIDPKNSRAKHNIPLYSKQLALKKTKLANEHNEVSELEIMEIYNKANKAYEAQCRGETVVPIEIHRRLRCRYLFETHAYLKIAPIKMEIMFINPDIVMFRDVLSDNEIKTLKKIATLKFKHTSVPRQEHGTTSVVAKSSWLNNTKFDIAARISRRITVMTGLNIQSTERLEVVNYGIGGHYENHYDTPSSNRIDCTRYDKNKIATVMFYMSDVHLGGATVFTKLGLNVYPVKGAALFWLNMHPSGERNTAMMHADCPVLLGSKWVCNKFIRHCGQEFLKPCNLVRQRETDTNNFRILHHYV